MRRRLARPYGSSLPTTRLLSLIMAVGVLAMLYQRVKEPGFWGWLTHEGRAETIDVNGKQPKKPNGKAEKPAARTELVIPGPNESDPEELIKLRSNLKGVTDRRKLEAHEMPAYWQFLRWSRTRPIAELEKTARRDLAYTQLWEQPNLYRGQPIRLALHVQRVLKFEQSENPLGVQTVYEAWGWTDDSRSFPFVVVFTEKPPELPVGPEVNADIVAAGYFLKWLSYQAFDSRKKTFLETRNSPLLLGRVRMASRSTALAQAANSWESKVLTGLIFAVTLGLLVWFAFAKKGKPVVRTADGQPIPDQLPTSWLAENRTKPLDLTQGVDVLGLQPAPLTAVPGATSVDPIPVNSITPATPAPSDNH